MTLREELEAMLTAAVDRNPALTRMIDADDHLLKLEGSPTEVMQQAVSALNAYSDALLGMTLHLADAIDDLGER